MLDRQPVRALLFDIDGTLADTDDLYVQYLTHKLELFMTPEAARRNARRLVMQLETPLNTLYQWADRLNLDEIWKKFSQARTKPKPSQPFMAIPGIEQALQKLHKTYPLAVVSARGHHGTTAFLEQFGLQTLFSTVITAHSCRKNKPHPDPLLLAASRMNVRPEECVMIGDTVMDIRAGKAAGCQTIGVLCGFGTRQELAAAGADLVLASTVEVADLFLPSGLAA
jgi:N-acetyl-D-muramate 6-phosphate phosphatase